MDKRDFIGKGNPISIDTAGEDDLNENLDNLVTENDKRLYIILTTENATNLGRYCHTIGQNVDHCDISIRQMLEEYLTDILKPADLKSIKRIINTERREKVKIEKEEEKKSKPVWDKRKL